MVHTLHRVKEFLSYQQHAQTKYYIHSPFVYQFYLNVLEGPTDETKPITALRSKLIQTYDKILIDDMGAEPGQKEKLVSHLASKASIPDHYGHVLYRIVKYFSPRSIIELGTCLGLGTCYMALGDRSSQITTIEGSAALSALASQNFNTLGLGNIATLTGHFDDRLPELLSHLTSVDMVFIDGNHRYEPTLRYFSMLMTKAQENTILIFDDIYWSPEMTDAWQAIKSDPRVSLTIDIYRFGIAFMRRDKLAKEDFILRY